MTIAKLRGFARLRQWKAEAAETRGGNVQASDWDGDIEAHSAGGQIAVDRIRGRSELRTAGAIFKSAA